MYLSFKNNILFSKKRRLSCLQSAEHVILDMIDDNSWKTKDILFKCVAIDSFHLTLQVIIKKHLSLVEK